MGMLYVTTEGASIRKRGESFVVTTPDGTTLADIQARDLEQACILSSVQVTTQALVEMLKHSVSLSIFSSKGQLLGHLAPPLSKNIILRHAQFDKERDPAFTLEQARHIVAAKVHNQCEVLHRYTLDEPGEQPETDKAINEMKNIATQIPGANALDVLLGLEGACARAYWGVFGLMLKPDNVTFEGRRQHPATDPINACLSFGYVLLGNLIHATLEGLGFDPFLGFFHEPSYGRASLALDILEPFRAPVVDRMVIRTFNLGILKPEHFQPQPDGGLRLTPDALKSFFREWEHALHKLDVRALLRAQAEDLRHVYLGEKDAISPWRWSAR